MKLLKKLGTSLTLILSLSGGFFVIVSAPAFGAEVVVNISGITDPIGQIGCALYANSQGFPMENTTARGQWLPPDTKDVTCHFTDVTNGTYAVSVVNDANGNHKVDTNFFGIPKEQWGVSNNVRPGLRAPRFDEAAFKVSDGKDLTIEVQVAK